MIGTKLYKNNAEAMDIYPSVAKWCNENNAHIEDKGDFYEVVENPPIEPMPIDDTPTMAERIEAIEEAITELAEMLLADDVEEEIPAEESEVEE